MIKDLPSKESELSLYMTACRETEDEFQTDGHELLGLVQHIGDNIKAMLGGGNDPVITNIPVSGALALNSIGLFMASARTVLGGHPSAAFPQLRAALESMLYAVIARLNPDGSQIWLDRKKNPRACKKVFVASKAVELIRPNDTALADFVISHYEGTIEYGAHPNYASILTHLALHERHDGLGVMDLTIIQNAGSSATLQAMGACVEIGVLLLLLGHQALGEKPSTVAAHATGCAIWKQYLDIIAALKSEDAAEVTT